MLPVRMLNEFVYCPRLFCLEHVNGEWADSEDTIRGRTVHRRVDQETRRGLPDPGVAFAPTRSVLLGDVDVGLIARIDLVEEVDGKVVPIDYKQGRPPKDSPAYEPEQVQLCAQALLLRSHGYDVDYGYFWFAKTRSRTRLEFTDELVERTLRYRDAALAAVHAEVLPPVLIDSPKCPRCSLVGICLPDETALVTGSVRRVRPVTPARDDRVPLVVDQPGAFVGRRKGELIVRLRGEELGRARLADVGHVVVRGSASMSTAALRGVVEQGAGVSFESFGGWLWGVVSGARGHNVLGRIAQHRVAAEQRDRLAIARRMIHGKIRNSRVLLRRNGRAPARVLDRMAELARAALTVTDESSLLGVEGAASRDYFQNFATMLAGTKLDFDWSGRNRRPPMDPINALLSFAYSVLVREAVKQIEVVGLDPWVGVFHRPRANRPALALDVIEEFRPVVADSAVLTAVNNGEVGDSDFLVRNTGVTLTKAGRRRFVRVLERRLSEQAVHPVFGRRLSYRRSLEVQVRMLGKAMTGEIAEYPEIRIR